MKITIQFNTGTPTIVMQIPYDAKVVFASDANNHLHFAYEIHGKLFKPQFEDVCKCQRMYGVKSYKVVSEYLKGEVLRVIPVIY